MQPTKKLLPLAIAAAAMGYTGVGFAQADNSNEEAEIEQVVVTGSRIVRSTFETPAPTTVIDAENIKMSGELNLNEMLSTMPQFGEGYDSTSGSYSFGNSGLNALDLRDMGTIRTLSLVNGHRPVQVTTDSNTMVTDIGMIPSELVERVEVMTGGASAVYGADAVAGVVNFILKDDYEGASFRTQFGDSEAGGAANRSATFTFGQNFDDGRGNVAVSLDYFKQDVLHFRDRKDAAGRTRYISNPENTGPDDGIKDFLIHNGVTYPDFNIVGNTFGIWNGAESGTDWYMLEGDQARLSTPAANIDAGWKALDGTAHDPNAYNFARSPYERINAYSRVTYELTDDLRISGDIMYSGTESYDEIDPDFIWGSWFTVTELEGYGISVPDAVADLANTDGGWLNLPYTFDEAGPRWHETEREYLSASLTLDGTLANDWRWNTRIGSGYTKGELRRGNNLRYDRIDIGTFQVIGPCEETGNCPSFSPFEPASQELIDYVMVNHNTYTDVQQHTFAANLSGDVFSLPAGDIQFGVGVEGRSESLDYQPSELWQSGLLSSQQTPINDKSRTVKEVYGELLVPLLSEMPLVQSLELETAVRGAEYSTENANFTSWKSGLNWAINDSVRFRTSFSESVRAPQLGEMYLGTSIGYGNVTDPCDVLEIDGGPSDGRREINCRALGIPDGWESNLNGQRGRIISEGNEDLKEEEASTLTAGFIFTPSFVDGLNISIDYYDIDLTDMIVRFGASDTLALCVDSTSIQNDFCAQVERAANGDVVGVRDTFINADGSRRRGIDLELDYQFSLADSIGVPGDLRLNLLATKQLEHSYSEVDGATGQLETTEYAGEFGSPEYKADMSALYSLNDLSVRWTTKFTEGGPIDLDGNPERYQGFFVKDSLYHNLWAGYQVNESTELYLGVNNVSDERWTDHPYTSYGSNNYSLLGRYLYAGATLNF